LGVIFLADRQREVRNELHIFTVIIFIGDAKRRHGSVSNACDSSTEPGPFLLPESLKQQQQQQQEEQEPVAVHLLGQL
jgi:hypothetical protein